MNFFKGLIFIAVLVYGFDVSSQSKRTSFSGTQAEQLNPDAQKIITDEDQSPTFIRFKKGAVIKTADDLKTTLGLPNGNSFIAKPQKTDALGISHQTFIQTYNGIEIIGSEYKIHINSKSETTANGKIQQNINVSTVPQLSEKAALDIALNSIDAKKYKWESQKDEAHLRKETNDLKATYYPKGKLKISRSGYNDNSAFTLVYQFDIYASDPIGKYNVEVSAVDGSIINQFNTLHSEAASGTGVSLYDGTLDIDIDYSDGDYYLSELTRGDGIHTYDLMNGTNYGSATLFSESDSHFDMANNQAGVSAHFGAGATYDYFLANFGRDSYDNNGGAINSYVHYSSGYFNAFWDGYRMTYGDGDGFSSTALVSLDIVGHEIGHAVTQYSADLIYSYESGALNESFSDIFGQSIEFENFPATASWNLADQIYTDGVSMIRSMSDPNSQEQPDTYLGDMWYTGSGDNGGVHYNSGVQNFWYYLLVDGGSGTNDIGYEYDVTGVGLSDAQQIAYRNLTVYLTSNSDYLDARSGAELAAIDLFGVESQQYESVVEAWNAVGVPTADPLMVVAEAISFDNAPIGYLQSYSVQISNLGTGILVIDNIEFDNSAFSSETTSLAIQGLESKNITFYFLPDQIASFNGIATLTSNAGTETISLSGVGVAPPNFVLSEENLTEDLFSGQTATQSLTIDNSEGESPLIWSSDIIYIEEEPEEPIHHAPIGFYANSSPNLKASSDIKYDNQSPAGNPYQGIDAQVEQYLENFPNSCLGSFVIGNLAYTINYYNQSIDVYNIQNQQVEESISIHSSPFGITYAEGLLWVGQDTSTDVFAYDLNGNLQASFSLPFSGPSAITYNGQYFLAGEVFSASGIYVVGFDGTIIETISNPGIEFYQIEWNSDHLWLLTGGAPTATVLRTSVEDDALTIVDTISIPADQYSYTIAHYKNSILWADFDGTAAIIDDNFENSQSSWLSLSQNTGEIAAGASMQIEVSFDATTLFGGIYEADINFHSNDPSSSFVNLPTSLTVTGAPIMEVQEALAFDNMYIGFPKIDSIEIFNNGTDLLVIDNLSFEFDNGFSTTETELAIPANESHYLVLDFTPSEIQLYEDSLIIQSNDVNGTIKKVYLSGTGVVPPVIAVNPESLSQELYINESESQTLTIDNTAGGADLIFSIEINDESELYQAYRENTFYTSSDEEPEVLRKIAPIPMSEISALTGTKHILAWTLYTDHANEYYNTMNAIAQYFTDFTIQTSQTTDAIELQAALDGIDVFLFPEQEGGYDNFYRDLGSNWSEVLQDFVNNGGTIIQCGSSYGAEQLFTGSGLMDIYYYTRSSSGYMDVTDSTHPMTLDFPSQIAAQYYTSRYSINDPDVLDLVTYDSRTVVGYRSFGNGHLVILGYDFDNYDDHAAQLIANAVTLDGGHDWLNISLKAGTVPFGETLDIEVEFDASKVYGGYYETDIVISNNDPANPELIVPVTFDVTGIADIDLETDVLDFGQVFVGYEQSRTLRIFNTGTDSLGVTSVDIDNPDFSIDTTYFGIEAKEFLDIVVTYLPSSVEVEDISMVITSDDPNEATVTVELIAEGVDPPILGVDPEFFNIELMVGETSTETFTVDNTEGGSDLIFEVSINLVNEFKNINSLFNGETSSEETDHTIITPTASITGEESVLVIQNTSAWGVNMADFILSNFGLSATTIGHESLAGTDLTSFDIVITVGDESSSYYNTLSANVTKLEDFVDEGGILQYQLATLGSSVELVGGAQMTYGGQENLNTIVDESHPIVNGLPIQLEGSSANHCFITNLPIDGNIIVETTSSGLPTLVEYSFGSGYVVATGMTVEYLYDNGYNSGPILGRMFQYSADQIGAYSWLSTALEVDTIFSGQSKEYGLLFDATNLLGGIYEANVTLSSNDPSNPEVIIPATLHVSGVPIISVDVETLEFDHVFAGYERTESIRVSNEGSDVLEISSVTIPNTDFVPSTTSFEIEPGEYLDISISYNPIVIEGDTTTLTLASNDPEQPLLIIDINANAIGLPVVSVTPESITEELISGNSIVHTLTIDNIEGGSDLVWSLNFSNPATLTALYDSNKERTSYTTEGDENNSGVGKIAPISMEQINTLSGTKDILAWTTYADMDHEFPNTINAIAQYFTDFTLSTTTTTDPEEIASLLSESDIFLIPEQEGGNSSFFSNLGTTWSHVLNNFVSEGGTIILCGSFDSSHEILNSSGLLSLYVSGGIDGAYMDVLDPAHPLTLDFPSQILSQNATVLYSVTDPDAVDIVTYNSSSAVSYKAIGTGNVVLLGYDYYAYDNHAAQLIANAVTLSTTSNWLNADITEGTVEAGESFDLDVTLDATELKGGVYGLDINIVSNDPVTPELAIPVSLTVTGFPNLTTNVESIDFGQQYTGYEYSTSFTVTNDGSDLLDVTSIEVANPDFTLDVTDFELAPGNSIQINVDYNPVGTETDDFNIIFNSNDLDDPAYAFGVTAEGIGLPVLSVTPGSLSETLSKGSSTQYLTIDNSAGESSLNYTLVVGDVGSGEIVAKSEPIHGIAHDSNAAKKEVPSTINIVSQQSESFAASDQNFGLTVGLSDVLDNLNANFTNINSIIPERYDFYNGETGYYISDGGGDMYDGGNYLATDLGGYLTYTNGAISNSSYLGNADYFTAKYPGLFVLAADLNDVNYFEISGDLGADGSGTMDASILSATVASKQFTGYVKRVYNAGDPSVNHLIIVQSNESSYHSYDTNTNSDYHIVQGLNENDRIYHLLFAGVSGYYINDDHMLLIMQTFLESIGETVDFFNIPSPSGTIDAGQMAEVAVDFVSDELEIGSYESAITVTSNDPVNSQIVVPLDLTVVAHEFRTKYLEAEVCFGETYFVEGADQSKSGTYYDSLHYDLYDSVFVTTLTINELIIYDIPEDIVLCHGETLFFDGIELSETGTYSGSFTTENGCDSLVTVNVINDNLDKTISYDGQTLVANQVGVSYQWLDCSNGNEIIPGQTARSFTPTESGQYAVIVSTENCLEVSECVPDNLTLGLEDLEGDIQVEAYPNPSDGNITVRLTDQYSNGSYQLLDFTGRVIDTQIFENKTRLQLKIKGSIGLYLLRITDRNDDTVIIKLIKE